MGQANVLRLARTSPARCASRDETGRGRTGHWTNTSSPSLPHAGPARKISIARTPLARVHKRPPCRNKYMSYFNVGLPLAVKSPLEYA